MTLQIRRGLAEDLPSSPADGELLYTTDKNLLYIGDGGTPREIAGSLVTNEDGSKSILVDTTAVVVNTMDAGGFNPEWVTDMMNPNESYFIVSNNTFTGAENFVQGAVVTAWSDAANEKGTQRTFTLLTDLVFDSGNNEYRARTVETAPSSSNFLYNQEIITTLTTGSETSYNFDNQGTFTTPSLVADSALIGDVSIIDNQIAVEDAYGLPGTLAVSAANVEFAASFDVNVNGLVETTDIIPDIGINFAVTGAGKDTPRFTYASMDTNWVDASKFVTGSVVSFTDDQYGPITIQLTTDMSYSSSFMRWQADYTLVSGGQDVYYSSYNTYSPTVTNTSGSVTSYSFDDQGTFTAPTVSTDTLLVDGVPAALLTANQDGSKSIVVDTFVEEVETISAVPSTFELISGPGTPLFYVRPMGGLPFDASKLTIGTIVSLEGMSSSAVIELTSDFTYDNMDDEYSATYNLISGSVGAGITVNSVTITNTSGSVVNYDFTSAGFVADSALIGDVSIIDNQIAVEDAYGLPGTLAVSAANVEFAASFDVNVNGLVETTDIIPDIGVVFSVRGAEKGTPYFSYDSMDGNWVNASKFVTGSVVSLVDDVYGPITIELTTDMAYDYGFMQWRADYNVVSGGESIFSNTYSSYSPTVVNSSGSKASYNFGDQGTFSTTSLISDSALIGDVSIIANQIAVEDAYGLPGTLAVSAANVEFDSSFNLNVDSFVETIETITTGESSSFNIDASIFMHQPMGGQGATFYDPAKFVTGTIVSLTDSMYGTVEIQLTADLAWDDMDSQWEASYTLISGSIPSTLSDDTVIITNRTGDLANYSFDDQGTFTAPTVSTDTLLVDGVPAALLTANQDGSKSIVVNGVAETTETIPDIGVVFSVRGAEKGTPYFSYDSMDSNWADASKFVTGSLVSLVDDQYGPITIELTTDMAYSDGFMQWRADYNVVSGGESIFSNTYSSYSPTVTNTSGSATSYNFDDQGTFTTPSLVADSALIGDVSIIDNTIAGTNAYGQADTLVVYGDLEVTGEIISDAVLLLNEDGSKSVGVGRSVTEDIFAEGTAGFSVNSAGNGLFTYSNEIFPDSTKFTTGTTVTIISDGWGTGVVQLTSDLTYSATQSRWEATYSVIGNSMSVDTGFLSSSSVTITYEQTASYNFDDQGTFTAPSLVAESLVSDSALIGHVSIIDNTISGINAYGQPGTLVVDGDLDIEHTATIITDYTYGSPPLAGEWDGSVNWYNTTLSWPNASGSTLTLIQSLKVGDKVTFTTSGTPEEITLTLTSTPTYNEPNERFEASVAETTDFELAASTSYPITITTTGVKTTSFTTTGLTVDGDLEVFGNLTLADTDDTPVSAATPVKYAKVVVAGQIYYMPLFQ